MGKSAAATGSSSNAESTRAKPEFVLVRKVDKGYERVVDLETVKAGREYVVKEQIPGNFEVHTVRDEFSAGEQKSFVLT